MPQIARPFDADVEGRDDLGQQRRVPVGDTGDERAQAHPVGHHRQRAEGRVGLEHLELGRAQHRQLPEVVHHPHRVEAGLLGGPRLFHHPVEQGVSGVVSG